MTTAEARLHIRYSGWASRRLVDAIAELSPEDRTRPVGVSHESIQKTLGHIYSADAVWYMRTVDTTAKSPTFGEIYPMETLLEDWRELQRKWEVWVDSVADQDLERDVDYKFLNGSQGRTPTWQIVMHVVNHATLHRGQVMGMIRQLGVKPPGTDLITYYRELAEAAAAG